MEFKKVTKTQVRAQLKKLKSGESLAVFMLPSNIRPGTQWFGNGLGALYNNEGFRTDVNEIRTFQQDIDAYTYYNCFKEVGKYIHFYVHA